MLLHIYQIFSSLRGHLYFSVRFSLYFHGNFFLNNPLPRAQAQNRSCGLIGFSPALPFSWPFGDSVECVADD